MVEKIIWMTSTLICCCLAAFAQNLPAPAATPPGLPVLNAFIGSRQSGNIPLVNAKQLLDSSLTATDKKSRNYKVVSFDFGYLRTDTTYNDTTGIPALAHEYLGYTFRSDRLDSLWSTRISGELQAGEQLYFDHIIAEDDNGEKYLASPIHLKVTD